MPRNVVGFVSSKRILNAEKLTKPYPYLSFVKLAKIIAYHNLSKTWFLSVHLVGNHNLSF